MSFDNHANAATSTVAVAPSPTTTGLTLTVATGTGTLFPTGQIYVTVCPVGVLPLTSNMEIMRGSFTGDVFTITGRHVQGTTVRSVQVGDQIFNGITKQDWVNVESVISPVVYNVAAYAANGYAANGPMPTTSVPTPSTAGANDWTAAVQAACAADIAAGGGGIIDFPNVSGASYVVTGKCIFGTHSQIRLNSNTILVGNNALISHSTYTYADIVSGTQTRTRAGAGIFEHQDGEFVTVIGPGYINCNNKRQIGWTNGTALTLSGNGGSITSGATTFKVSNASVLPAAPISVLIGTEAILVSAINTGTNTLTVQPAVANPGGGSDFTPIPLGRGYRNTAATSHNDGAAVQLLFDGIYISNEANTATSTLTDSEHKITGVLVSHAPAVNIYTNGLGPTTGTAGGSGSPNQWSRGNHITDCKAAKAGLNNLVDSSSDSHMTSLHCGNSGDIGILAIGGNTRWTGVKHFFSGQNNVTAANWKITARGQSFAACESQDAWGDGVWLTASECNVQFLIDSSGKTTGVNGAGSPAYVGLRLDGGSGNVITIASHDRHNGGNSNPSTDATQQYAVGCVNTPSNNVLIIAAKDNGTGTVSGSAADLEGNSFIGPWTRGANSTTAGASFTPDINSGVVQDVTMTSGTALTVAAPVMKNLFVSSASNVAGPCFYGQEFTLIIRQGATGAAVTMNGVYNLNGATISTANNAITALKFYYDGTNWLKI